MKCPRCKDRTEVLETRHQGECIRRRRKCLSPHCQQRFTTTESSQRSPGPVGFDEAAARAAQLAKQFRWKGVDKEAFSAALATDLRRAEIARAQKAARREERESGYDAEPRSLSRDQLRDLGVIQ